MILTPHIIAGAALATRIHNPILLAASALALHHMLDMIPHWDYDILSSKKLAVLKIGIDMAIAIILMIVLIWNLSPREQILMLYGGFFGILPDGLLFLNIISGRKLFARFVRFHDFWHHLIIKKDKKPPLILGFATQIITISISLLILKIFH